MIQNKKTANLSFLFIFICALITILSPAFADEAFSQLPGDQWKDSDVTQKGQGEYDFFLKHNPGSNTPQNLEQSLYMLLSAAEVGNPFAQDTLAGLYWHIVSPPDNEEALRWERKSAETGYGIAELKLCELYRTGGFYCPSPNFKNCDNLAPVDYSEAAKWCLRAAEYGIPNAQFHIGMLYYVGKGVPKNVTEGIKWIRMAITGKNDEITSVGQDTKERWSQLIDEVINKDGELTEAPWPQVYMMKQINQKN